VDTAVPAGDRHDGKVNVLITTAVSPDQIKRPESTSPRVVRSRWMHHQYRVDRRGRTSQLFARMTQEHVQRVLSKIAMNRFIKAKMIAALVVCLAPARAASAAARCSTCPAGATS
jgi:hypothetical protein